ncbi:50S ribosomal protein L11 methyltransferase [Alteribacillus sp. HJP-4]|uniref:50S ribosomal protein L11 methyltransferase n=1 Tax=Alteribacillus sp. HJP-4 TaxID=2775394 RepID=UPI0035CD18AA
MRWTEFRIHTEQEAVEPISNILHEAGASGVVIEDSEDLIRNWNGAEDEIYDLSENDYPAEGVIVKAYFPVTSFAAETAGELKQTISNLAEHNIKLGKNQVSLSEVHEEDWADAWKKYYKPVKVTKTITIAPSWENYHPVSTDEHVIELDPGMAFGTGTHPSTVLALQGIEHAVESDDTVIDVGTGSGVLSIASAKLGAGRVLALDLDETAVKSASENVKFNKVNDNITVKQNDLLLKIDNKADIIVANILAEIILRMIDDAGRLLKTGGKFITSGIISRKKEDVKEALLSKGFIIEETLEMEDWAAFIAIKK